MAGQPLSGQLASTSLSAAHLRALLMGLYILLAAIGAQIAFPLPPFGVPQTLQTLVVILAALHLGPRWGTCGMLAYIAIGAIGAPVFSKGEAGLGVVLGQTGGYLVGFVVCQPIIAACVRRPDGSARGWGGIVLGSLLGHAAIFAIGVPWLYLVRRFDASEAVNSLSIRDALYGGFVVFIPGTILKTLIAYLIARASLPWAMKRIW
ncbi:MAG: biotin transporter BioY [Phycisphaeraceae bacterium]|nr:biotin transporter BioY [Phycisphaeraceae bacterium]MBX3365909.1 biotin transporter BioY [Phycisphaeraceae bacterium]QYK48417.1 MAG: biotin transporter BioY [Phycisphaeraceae bacterium]